MSDFGFFTSILIVACFLTAVTIHYLTYTSTMEEAYSQGMAVECMGKSGYHFTCDDKK